MAEHHGEGFPEWIERCQAALERAIQELQELRDQAFSVPYNAWTPPAVSSALAALETANEFATWECPERSCR